VNDTSKDDSNRPLWPGQVESIFLDISQIKTLCSPIRSMVYWGLDSFEAKSASDLGAEIGKTPQTVRYHLSALLELGLILAVGTRRRRSRTETLYVRTARRSFTRSDGDSLYNSYVLRAFKLEAQKLVREAAHYYGWREHSPEAMAFSSHRHFHLRLSKERAITLKEAIRDILFEASFDQTSEAAGGVEVHAFAAIMPTLHQIKTWSSAAGIAFKDLNRDGHVEIDDDEE
jgi:DNA-binding transcriptional ArsR family regulator